MQSVHCADRFSTTVHFLIKHTTERLIQPAGFSAARRNVTLCQPDPNSFPFPIGKIYLEKKRHSRVIRYVIIRKYPEFPAATVVQFQEVSFDGGSSLTGTPDDSVSRWRLPSDSHAVVLRAALFRYQYRGSRSYDKFANKFASNRGNKTDRERERALITANDIDETLNYRVDRGAEQDRRLYTIPLVQTPPFPTNRQRNVRNVGNKGAPAKEASSNYTRIRVLSMKLFPRASEPEHLNFRTILTGIRECDSSWVKATFA